MAIADFQLSYDHGVTDEHSGAVPLAKHSAAELLVAIAGSCRNRRVVFDLDSTLLNNRPRNAKIMQEYGERNSEPLLSQAHATHFVNWDTRNSMKLAGLDDRLIDAHLAPYEKFWQQRFFTSDYCQYDVDIPGAVQFVDRIKQCGGVVCYLTGRDETMREGTVKSLETLGFPYPNGDDVTLVMNATREYSDDLFKQEAMSRFEKTGGILAAFDNEPAHINTYRRQFKEAVCVHLFTDHSMRAIRLLDGIYSIRNFLCDFSPDHE